MKAYFVSARLLLAAIIILPGSAYPKKPDRGSSPVKKVGVPQGDTVTGLAFVKLPAGCFRMGSPVPTRPEDDFYWKNLRATAPVDEDERPVHRVCLDAFSIGQTEVTAEAWTKVMGGPPPAGQGREPAGGVTWHAVQEFLRRLNAGETGARYRLPTEAEWEYACRAGQAKEPVRQEFTVIDGAWYAPYERYRERPSEVGKLSANAWGLHDMLGNVWEWTSDVYRRDAYRSHLLYNPKSSDERTVESTERAIRGASFRSEYYQVRCAVRGHYAGNAALPQIGFRLVKQR